MFVAMITAFIFAFILVFLTNKKENVTAVAEENTVVEASTNWDLILAKIEQDNADILAQEELAEIVGNLTLEIGTALDARKYDGIEAMEEIKAHLASLIDADWCRAHQLDAKGISIPGTWIHSVPEAYIAGVQTLAREICVSSVQNGTVFNGIFPALVLTGTCRFLFSGNVGSRLQSDGTLDRAWDLSPHETEHDEGWTKASDTTLVEVLVDSEEMKARIEAQGFSSVVVDGDSKSFIWNRYEVPASERGVTPSNTETKEIA